MAEKGRTPWSRAMPHILHYWPSVNLPTCYLAFFGNNLKTSSGGDGGECHGHHGNDV